VALYSVTIAGPRYSFPIFSESREWTVAVIFFPAKITGTRGCKAAPSLDRPGRAGAAVAPWVVVVSVAILAWGEAMSDRRRRVTSSTSRAG
jgi:hypothetical protein